MSGWDSKIRDAFGRYVMLAFAYGADSARPDVAAHGSAGLRPAGHRSGTRGRQRIAAAHTDVVNAYA